MNEKLKKAILNNNDLYEAVFSAQNINFRHTELIWYCTEKTPPFYSNLVTISRDWRTDEIFDSIEENFKRGNWEKWSIKDSFAALDLTTRGFRKLFDAQWLYLEAAEFTPADNSLEIEYEIVVSERILADWRKAWDGDEQLGKRIFRSAMLENPKIYFLAGYQNEKIVTGCLVNKTGEAFGISNFFAPDSGVEYWSEMIKFIHAFVNFADLVGYERKGLVKKLQPLGFEAVGDLTVWLRTA
ncbi:MAG TPA: hypothetical protein VGC97_13600 [Pyrinomonadaceae bacterium]|jgi:hypothetical protein